MAEKSFQFEYEVYNHSNELNEEDARLLSEARAVTKLAYAPYSNFYVGAVARLANGQTVAGTNQENASYPVGICAERVLLGNAATLYPGVGIDTLAISYRSKDLTSDHPISPCGMCRQSLLEYETRTSQQIRLILSGQQGSVYIVKAISNLLPFGFNSSELI
jgi:cytidine deaminase